MNLNYYIIYQYIFSNYDAFSEIIDVFERILQENKIKVSNKELNKYLKKENFTSLLDKEQQQYALTIVTFIENFSVHRTIEYINLGRKEKIARNVLRLLNQEKKDILRIQQLLNDLNKIPAGKIHLPTTMTLGIRVNLISEFVSNQLPYIGIAKNHINMRDVANMLNKSVISTVAAGQVGGKAAGMILANRILRPTLEDRDKELDSRIEEIDSYFIKSSIINEFIALNKLEECHSLKYLEGDSFEEERKKLYQRFMKGVFSENTLSRFRGILLKTEGSPLILRSSSYLEDSVGCSFTGKYDSIFISNRGTMKERLEELIMGIKQVYFSLYNANVIQYRKDNNLLDYNEKMSVLIQKVVGNTYGKYFFPDLAIVGFSKNPYCWNKRINCDEPMLRMVLGLGTRAVDRVGDDYPRITSLSAPNLRPEITNREKIKYSQRQVDVLNLETKEIETINFIDLLNYIMEKGYDYPVSDIISTDDNGDLARPMFKPDKLKPSHCAITFDGLLSNKKFISLMKQVFKKVEAAYKMPVDMEFVYHKDKLYILQCRTLYQSANNLEKVEIPTVSEDKILFSVNKGFYTNTEVKSIRYIIYIDGKEYDNINSHEKKVDIARMVGKLNNKMKRHRYILMGPGRWGSNNIDLGVQVRYGDINNTKMLIEIAWEKNGITPELSYGTHFFQDLVEADIIPLPLFPNDSKTFFQKDFFKKAKNLISEFEPKAEKFRDVIKLVDIRKETGRLLNVYLDVKSSQGVACFQ